MATNIVSDLLVLLAGITGFIAAFTKLLPLLVQLVRAGRDFYVALPHHHTRRRRARAVLRSCRSALRPSFQSALRCARPRSVVRSNDRLNSTTHVKITHDPHPSGGYSRDEIIKDVVDDTLVKDPVIAKAPEV